MSTPTTTTTPTISLSTLKTDIASVLSAGVGLIVGLGVLPSGTGQDILSIGGIVLAGVFQIVGVLGLGAKLKAATLAGQVAVKS